MTVLISLERPDSPDAQALIAELDAEIEPLYARASRHGYSVETLIAQGVISFVIRQDGEPAGCCGIELERDFAEVKRMYVRPAFRGLGLSRRMLGHLTDYARDHSLELLRLETGVHQHAAIALYESAGFRRIPPFGEYFEDPVSLCYELPIRATRGSGSDL